MKENLIGSQIIRFRKQAGITQEELGRAAGVSTQAVSRWECGGTPDVALLPAIADRLGVTIDQLFGREGGERPDMDSALGNWIQAQPAGTRMERLCRLLWHNACFVETSTVLPSVDYLDSCYLSGTMPEMEQCWTRTVLSSEQGLLLGVGAENLEFMALFPEPEAGYAAFFAGNEAYRKLFAALAMPKSMEILLYLYSRKQRLNLPAAVANRIGCDAQTAEQALEAMASAQLIHKVELETESGSMNAYTVHDNYALVPFLYFARWLMEAYDSYHLCWSGRTTPVLRKDGEESEEK